MGCKDFTTSSLGYEFKKTKSKKGRERERGVLYCYNLIHTRQRSLKTSKANTEKFVMPGYITFESKKSGNNTQ